MRQDRHRTWASIIAAGVFLFLLAAPVTASAGIMEEEAERQLQLAEEDLEAGNFERAAASAASALRADPSRHEAFVVRGLALQGLGHLEDALALLRVYKDLRGTLEIDTRVEPAMTEVEQLLAGLGPDPAIDEPATLGPIEGPVAVVYGPDSDEKAAEQAYAAAQPFLGGQPAAAVLTLGSLLPRGEKPVVVGPVPLLCDDIVLEGTLEGHLVAAEAATVELEPEVADEATDSAEQHLACGDAAVEPETVARLLEVRAQARWLAGEPEVASSLWREMFAVNPERLISTDLPPSAQALQLDAKTHAAQEGAAVDLQAIVPKGWSLRVDGVKVATEVRLSPGRRILRLTGPKGARLGLVLPLMRGRRVLVGTADAMQEALYEPRPPGLLLGWVSSMLGPAMEQQGAQSAVVVNLDMVPPTVRVFDGQTFLVVTPSPKEGTAHVAARGERRGPHPASVTLVGGGLAATVAGLIIAAVSRGQGQDALQEMGTLAGYHTGYDAYETARTGERAGAGLAIGGGVLAVAGGVTFALPHRKAVKPAEETAAR